MAVREARGSVPQAVLDTARRVKAPLLVTDRGYERTLRAWRREVGAQSPWYVACGSSCMHACMHASQLPRAKLPQSSVS